MPQFDVVVVGSYVQDHCWTVPVFPATGETRIGHFATGPGGKGFNQAVACHRQGVATCFIGALGQDPLADAAKRFANEIGLPALWETCAQSSTAASSILVDGRGDNRIVVALGANEHLSPEFVLAQRSLIEDARLLVCQLENQLSATRCALEAARQAGVRTLLNPAPIHEHVSPDLLRLADVLTPNETEFAFLLQKLHGLHLPQDYWQVPDSELHQLCAKLGVPTVVLTLGAQGCFVSHQSPTAHGDRAQYYRMPAERVDALDTTGAGDAFNGGLAAAWMLFGGQGFARMCAYANQVAALSTEKPGTAPAMPTRAETERRFAC